MKEYDLELNRIAGQLAKIKKVDQGFYLTAGYIITLAKHGAELFKRSEPEERRLLIKTVLLNATWNGEKLQADYVSPFDLLIEMNKTPKWGAVRGWGGWFAVPVWGVRFWSTVFLWPF